MDELYQLPDGWEFKRLDELTEIVTKGTTPTTNGYSFLNSGINFLKIENIINGEISLESIHQYISEEAHQSQKRSMLQENDVLFSIAGTIGDTAIVKKDHLPMNTNQALAIIRPKKVLSPWFLKYSLLSIVSQNTKDKQRGGAIKNISLTDIKNTNYPLPPLEEQKRIVSKLDDTFSKLDRAIQLHQENINEANAYMSSVLNEVFSELEEKCEKKPLKDIVDNLDGKRRPIKASDRESISGEYPYYGASGIIDYVNDYIFDGEYLLISEDGANLTVRKYPIAFIAQGKFWVNNHAHIVTAKLEVSTNRYMEYAFAYIDISSYITGSAQPKLSQGKMNIIEFVIPPLEEQKKTVEYLDDISSKMDKIKSLQKVKLQELKALKASILVSAFRGEL